MKENETISEMKFRKKHMYDLGWVEKDPDEWFCGTCRQSYNVVMCSCILCQGSCEWCRGEVAQKEPEKS